MNDPFRVIAIVAAFNEGDIISAVIGHLIENGVDVYLLDNHSTDDTVEQARRWLGRGLLHIESFPARAPSESGTPGPFDWTAILRRKEELARELAADWFIHHDADEIRESPWPGLTLKEAIRWVDSLGYDCIDFRVFDFPPIDDSFKQGDDPRRYFTCYENAAEFDALQLKCWKGTETPVSLVSSGGHEARLPGRRAFPIQFLLRHYPIRGQAHGMRKVFAERKSRFLQAERSKGWHVQYDDVRDETHSFLRDPSTLKHFDLDRARLELSLPDRILRNLAERVLRSDQELDNLRLKKEDLENQNANLVREHDQVRLTVAKLQSENDKLMQRVPKLERERDELKKRLIEVQSERDQLRQTIANLEHGRDDLKKQVIELQGDFEQLRSRAGHLEQTLTDVSNSRSWRWTAPLRRIFDMRITQRYLKSYRGRRLSA